MGAVARARAAAALEHEVDLVGEGGGPGAVWESGASPGRSHEPAGVGIETSLSQRGTEGWGPEPQMGSCFWCLVPEDPWAATMRKWDRLGHEPVRTQWEEAALPGTSNSRGQRWP